MPMPWAGTTPDERPEAEDSGRTKKKKKVQVQAPVRPAAEEVKEAPAAHPAPGGSSQRLPKNRSPPSMRTLSYSTPDAQLSNGPLAPWVLWA